MDPLPPSNDWIPYCDDTLHDCVRISWPHFPGATYTVRLGTSSYFGTRYNVIEDAQDIQFNEYTINNLTPSTTYYVIVDAKREEESTSSQHLTLQTASEHTAVGLLKQRLGDVPEKLRSVEREVERLKEDNQKLRKQIDDSDKQRTADQQIQEKLDETLSQLEHVQFERDQLRDELESVRDAHVKQRVRIASLDTIANAKDDQLLSAEHRLRESNDRCAELEKLNNELQEHNKRLQEDLANIQHQLEDDKENANRHSELQDQISNLEIQLAECKENIQHKEQTAFADMQEAEERITLLSSQLRHAEEEKGKFSCQISNLETQLAECQEIIQNKEQTASANMQETEEKIKSLTSQLENADEEKDNFIARVSDLEIQLAECKKSIQHKEGTSLADIQKAKEEIKLLTNQLEENKDKFSTHISNLEEKLATTSIISEQAQREVTSLQGELARTRKATEALNDDWAEREQKLQSQLSDTTEKLKFVESEKADLTTKQESSQERIHELERQLAPLVAIASAKEALSAISVSRSLHRNDERDFGSVIDSLQTIVVQLLDDDSESLDNLNSIFDFARKRRPCQCGMTGAQPCDTIKYSELRSMISPLLHLLPPAISNGFQYGAQWNAQQLKRLFDAVVDECTSAKAKLDVAEEKLIKSSSPQVSAEDIKNQELVRNEIQLSAAKHKVKVCNLEAVVNVINLYQYKLSIDDAAVIIAQQRVTDDSEIVNATLSKIFDQDAT